jgi:glyoxylase-like metal-dependent hydrolase (beta-lactamase superfamily II)
MEIIPGVHWLDLGISNCYLIVEQGELTLVDAGVKRSYRQIVELIHSLGFSTYHLKRILLTHADYDHVGATTPLRAENSAEVFASQIAAEALANGHSSRQIHAGIFTPLFSWFEELGGAMRIEVDKILAEGDCLPVLGGLKVLETPGHTPGHISFYATQHRLLFAGDSVSTQPDLVLYNRVQVFNWDQQQMIASVHRQQTIEPEIVCSGHGPVVFEATGKFPI